MRENGIATTRSSAAEAEEPRGARFLEGKTLRWRDLIDCARYTGADGLRGKISSKRVNSNSTNLRTILKVVETAAKVEGPVAESMNRTIINGAEGDEVLGEETAESAAAELADLEQLEKKIAARKKELQKKQL